MKVLRGFLLLQSSATTNESLSRGDDITTAMKTFFPSIHYADVKALITVCNFILSVKVSMLIWLFRPIQYQILLPPRIFSSKLLQETRNLDAL